MRLLHVVNGDSVGEKLRSSAVGGDVLVWREVYSHGPVVADLAVEEARMERAAYLERTMGVPSAEYLAGCEEQERALARFAAYEEVVLWFEHDLFDQTMLCRLLHWFSAQPAAGEARLSWVGIDRYPGVEPFRGLGQLEPDRLAELLGERRAVGAAQLALGRAYWEAYAAPEPLTLQRLLDGGDAAVLPFAGEAFRCHLSRYPSLTDGLGIVERVALETARAGVVSPYELFRHAGDRLHVLGMGDLQFWHILRGLSQGSHPLLRGDGVAEWPSHRDPAPPPRGGKLQLTELGERVLEGQADWAALNGVDEWYGGVRLQGHRPRWRWDPAARAIRETAGLA